MLESLQNAYYNDSIYTYNSRTTKGILMKFYTEQFLQRRVIPLQS